MKGGLLHYNMPSSNGEKAVKHYAVGAFRHRQKPGVDIFPYIFVLTR